MTEGETRGAPTVRSREHSHSHHSREDWELDRTKWNPSPEEFARYLAREVEMAKEAFAKGASTLAALYSPMTIEAALKESQDVK